MRGIIFALADPVSTRKLNCQLNGGKTMSTTKGFMLCAVLLLCTSAEALAHTDRSNRGRDELASRIYRTFNHCSPSKRIDLSRLQQGELAIMIQDRGFRESMGLPFDAGECW
jgi:hypothetical protein